MSKRLLLSSLVLFATLAGARAAHAACPDRIDDLEATSTGGVLERDATLYVAGSYVDLHLMVPNCTILGGATWDGVTLGAPGASIDPASASVEVPLNFQDGLGHRIYVVRVWFDNAGLGTPHTLSVKLGGLTTTWTVVGVQRVGGELGYTIAKEEIHNAIVAGIWDQFRGADRYESSVRVHDPSYDPTITLDEQGIRVQWSVGAQPEVGDWSYYCDTTVEVDTRFSVELDSSNHAVLTRRSDTVDVDDGYCRLVAWALPGLGLVHDLVVGAIEASLEDRLQREVDRAVDASLAFCQSAPCALLGLEIRPLGDRLDLALVDYQAPRVAVRVPYDSTQYNAPTIPIANGPNGVIVSATGVTTLCDEGWLASFGTCVRTHTGPAGLYNGGEGYGVGSNVPGIDPGLLYGGFQDIAGDLYRGLYKADRQLTGLPMREENIGQLVMNAGGTMRLGGRPCKLPAGTGGVGFGVNDTRRVNNAAYGTGSYEVTLTFGSGEESRLGDCQLARQYINGAIRTRWAMLMSEEGILGWPSTSIQTVANGWFADFARHGGHDASMYFQPGAPQAYTVWGAIRDKWRAMGGPTGWGAGWPQSEELWTVRDGRKSIFQFGTIYKQTQVDGGRPHAVINGIRDVYRALGEERGALGYPTTDEVAARKAGAVRSGFESGAIYWSASTGSHAVQGAIATTYAGYGAEASWLGLPRSEQWRSGKWWYQAFEGGTLAVYAP